MDRYQKLDNLLKKQEYDGYLQIDDSDNPNMYYLSGFDAPDPFVLFRHPSETILLVSQLEKARAEKESKADRVFSTDEFIEGNKRGDKESRIEILDSFLSSYGGEIAVPSSFSVYNARNLEKRGYSINIIEDIIENTRSVKSQKELKNINHAQRAAQKSMKLVENLLSEAEVNEGNLYIDKEKITSEYLRKEIKIELLRQNCDPVDPIVACGKRASDPHWKGEGSIKTNKPIVVDIFPKHESGYYADMTRTFLLGKNEKIKKMHNSVLKAQKAAFEVLEEGVTGEDVHYAVCESLEKDGYKTQRQGSETGFIHSTGHGVGLSLHEKPRISEGASKLKKGNVVTIEPGLYDPKIGGIRVEDLVIVKKNGYKNLTNYEKKLRIRK